MIEDFDVEFRRDAQAPQITSGKLVLPHMDVRQTYEALTNAADLMIKVGSLEAVSLLLNARACIAELITWATATRKI